MLLALLTDSIPGRLQHSVAPPEISRIMYFYLILPIGRLKIRHFYDFCCVWPPWIQILMQALTNHSVFTQIQSCVAKLYKYTNFYAEKMATFPQNCGREFCAWQAHYLDLMHSELFCTFFYASSVKFAKKIR